MGVFKMPLPPGAKPGNTMKLPDVLKPFQMDLFRERHLPTFSQGRLKACGAIVELYSHMFRYDYFWQQPAFKESINQRAREITRKELAAHLNSLATAQEKQSALTEAIRAER